MTVHRVLLLMNDRSRRGAEHVAKARAAIADAGMSIVNAEDFTPDRFGGAIRAHAASVDAVIVGGGDGSVNACVGAVLETKIPLGVLPLGTANNLARGLGLPQDFEPALKAMRSGHTRAIDVGFVNDAPFLVVAGMGISIHVNRDVKAERKKKWGVLAYVVAAAAAFRTYRPFRAEIVTHEGVSTLIRSLQISVCNGRHFGSGLTVSQDATPDDGLLDLCSIEVRGWWQIPGVALALKRGTYERHHPVLRMRSAGFTIRTHRSLRIDTDGEVSARTPATVSIRSQVLRVLVPPPETGAAPTA